MSFKFKIKLEEFPLNTVEEIQTGEVYYSMFGEIIFLINDRNFFENASGIPWDKMGTSSMSNRGLTIPIYGFITQFINLMDNLDENKLIKIYEDQIDKEIIMEPSVENVTLAIRYCLSQYWYDGEGVKESIQIPISSYNTIPINTFKEGMLQGIREYLQKLLDQFPALKSIDEFMSLYQKVNK
ncbi:hypothetical protein [Priestia koreensis]|uniref:hypothetical protein n=1 Tax=Priestia koreensis TaxID=284581 RepID=UPI00345A5B33